LPATRIPKNIAAFLRFFVYYGNVSQLRTPAYVLFDCFWPVSKPKGETAYVVKGRFATMSSLFARSRGSTSRRDSAWPIIARAADPVPQQDRSAPSVGVSRTAEVSRVASPETRVPVGSLLYLGTLGLVAVGIAAVFCGTGLSLLAPPAREASFGSAARSEPEAIVLFPASRDDHRPPPQSINAVEQVASLPEPSGTATIAAPGIVRPSNSAAAPVPAPEKSISSSAGTRELLQHGDALLRTGDIVSARLFYERAANAGDGRAALRLGATFDPALLGRFGGKVQADAALARTWYSRALDLGVLEAKGQLNNLDWMQGK
jgi:hypothetical protein